MSTHSRRPSSVIFSILRPVLPLFVLSLVFLLLGTAVNTLIPQAVRVAMDTLSAGRPADIPAGVLTRLGLSGLRPGAVLWLCAGAVLLCAVLSGLCTYVSQTSAAKGSEAAVKSLRDRLFSHIQQLPFLWHTRNQTGDIIQRCTSDVDVIRNFIGSQLLEVIRTAILVLCTGAVMCAMNWRITLVAMAFLLVIFFYSVLFFGRIARNFLKADESEGRLSAIAQENLTGVRVVRAFGRERYETARFRRQNEEFADLWLRLGRLLSAYWSLGDLITGLQILTVSAVGIVQTVHGSITLGEFLAFVSYDSMMLWPVRGLGHILSEMSKTGVSLGRVRYILDSAAEADPSDALEPPMTGDIEFSHVTYSFGEGEPVLRDVSFRIPAGSTFAILGGTGSGKSTLMHLLDRLYELPKESGRITVGGVDIRRIRRSHLRRHIGMVLQEPFLFSRTIEENIRAARPEAEREPVRQAAQIAAVDRAVMEFPDGYDTMVGERGVTLSGGQKQRVAIARMLMQEAPIRVFDDSLSAVDTETDAKIRAALRERAGRATTVLISHRITTLMQADRILVLENGRVAESGTHRELLRLGGIYRKIYDVQAGRDEPSAGRKEATGYGV